MDANLGNGACTSTWTCGLLATLTLLAIVHEGGHCLGAKLTRISVAAYEIGIGPTLLRWTDRRGTRYKLGLVPLGAFTKLREASGAGVAGRDSRLAGVVCTDIQYNAMNGRVIRT